MRTARYIQPAPDYSVLLVTTEHGLHMHFELQHGQNPCMSIDFSLPQSLINYLTFWDEALT